MNWLPLSCRRAGVKRCMPPDAPDMWSRAAGCRIPHDENRFLNAESRALARIRPDAAAFPVRRAYEVKNTEAEDAVAVFALHARCAHEAGADLRGRPCRCEGIFAAAQTGLPPCGHMRCALTAAYADRRCAYIDARRRSDAGIRRARGFFGRLRPADGLERAAAGAARVRACGEGFFRIGRRGAPQTPRGAPTERHARRLSL